MEHIKSAVKAVCHWIVDLLTNPEDRHKVEEVARDLEPLAQAGEAVPGLAGEISLGADTVLRVVATVERTDGE